MPTESHRKLSRHQYVAYRNSLPQAAMSFVQWTVERSFFEKPLPNLPPTVKLPSSLKAEIADVQAGLGNFTREVLGVDVSSRMPRRGQIHVFNEDNFLYLKKQAAKRERTTAFELHNNIYMPFDPQEETVFIHNLAHELVHLISGRTHLIRFRGYRERPPFDYRYLREGYAGTSGNTPRGKPFKAMNEFMTQTMTVEALKHMGKQDRLGVTSYPQLMPVGNRILSMTALAQETTVDQVSHDLMTGQLECNVMALSPVLRALGSHAKEFVHMDAYGPSLDAFVQKVWPATQNT